MIHPQDQTEAGEHCAGREGLQPGIHENSLTSIMFACLKVYWVKIILPYTSCDSIKRLKPHRKYNKEG